MVNDLSDCLLLRVIYLVNGWSDWLLPVEEFPW